MLEAARAYLDVRDDDRPRYLVFDFSAVSGVDSSAANSFAKLAVLARRAGAELLFCSVSGADRDLLARSGDVLVHDEHSTSSSISITRWSGAKTDCPRRSRPPTRSRWKTGWNGSSAAQSALRRSSHFDELRIGAKTALFRQGDPSDALFVVVSGRLRVSIEDHGRYRRLRSMVAGSVIGEMGMFANEPRSADVIAEQDATLLRLTRSAFARMNEQDPSRAGTFLSLLFRLEAERLRFASAEIAALEA